MAAATDNRSPYPASHYQIGGSLQLNAPTYVKRRADIDLYEGLSAGEFCYVLNCRQMGKSSLRVQVMAKLQAEGVACVAVQMTDIIDEEITPEQFYAGVIDSITMDLGLDGEGDFDNMDWWEANGELSLVKRFSKFLETVLLQKIQGKVVIFIDEIDRVLSMPFKVNGFFAAIRECYNKRSDQPAFRRLTFSLLGVATPSDLIEDKRSTPFNVGRAIALTGFTPTEAQPLAAGLGERNPAEILSAILKWTGGQPFLTQKVCRLVAENLSQKDVFPSTTAWMDHLVQTNIIENWQSNDEPEHLRTIRDRLLQDEQRAARRLGLYQQILAHDGQPVARANTADLNRDHMELRLSGLVVEKQSQLQVYNPIYAAIFTPAWAAQKLADLRPYAGAIAAWLATDRTDTALLLQGQFLNDAKQWADDKVLPPEDYAFLSASQELATAEAEEAQQVLAVANREATARMVTANRRLRIGSGILLGTIALFAFTGVYASDRIGKAQQASERAQSESAQALSQKEQAAADLLAATKTQAQLQEKTEQAQQDLEQAEAKSQRIEQVSQRRIGQAEETVKLAQLEAQTAESATQKAQQEQVAAQQEAEAAGAIASSAQVQATAAQASAAAAQQAEAAAKEKQEIVETGTALERQGTALLRRPAVQFRGLDALLDALELGKGLQDLIARDPQTFSKAGLQDSPAVSPLMALRLAVNSVLQTGQASDPTLLPDDWFDGGADEFLNSQRPPINTDILAGENSRYSEALQRIVKHNLGEDSSFLYDETGREITVLKGRLIRFLEEQQQLATYSEREKTIYLYTPEGDETVTFSGDYPRFSPNGQLVAIENNRTSSDVTNSDTTQLYNISGRELATLEGIDSTFSDDGQRIATSVDTFEREQISWLYDADGTKIAQLEGRYPAFSEGSRQRIITVSSQERSAQIYDYDGNQIAKLQGTRATLFTMGESSSDPQLIVDDGSNDLAVIYDLNGNQQVELKGLFSRTTPDGALLITSSRSDNLTRLYTPAGEQVQSYEGRYRNFSKDGQLIATYFSKEDETRVYDRTGIEIGSFEGQDAQFSWDGQRLLTVGGGGDRTARFYSVRGNNTLSSVKQSMVVLSEDGQLMVSVSEALETTQLRDLETEAVITLPGTFAGFTPDETGIAITSSQDNTIRLYDLSGTEQLAVEGSYLSFSADGESVIAATDEGEFSTRLYDRAGNKIANLAVPFATFSPDGNWIVGGSFNDGSVVTLYDRNGNSIASFEGSSARFSPDSQYVISTAIDFNSLRRSPNNNAVRTYLYDLSGNRLASLQGRLVGFTPDNKGMVTSSVFGAPTPGGGPSSWLYDFTGNEITNFTDPLILDFDAEGERVLTSSRGGGRSRLHDLNGNEIRSFEDSSPRFIDALQQIAVYSADDESTEFYDFAGQVTGPTSQGQTIQGRFKAYSPSGEYFVTNAYREDISRVYDAAGRLQAEFPGAVFERSSSDTVYISLEKPTNSLGFTPDGQRLLTQTKDGVYHLWTLDNGLEDLLVRGCDWVRPYLQQNENEARAAFCRQ